MNTAVLVSQEPPVPFKDITETIDTLSRFVYDEPYGNSEYGGRFAFAASLVIAVVMGLMAPAYFDRGVDVAPEATNLSQVGQVASVQRVLASRAYSFPAFAVSSTLPPSLGR